MAKEGEPPMDKAMEAWVKVYLEYLDLSKNPDTAYIASLQEDIALDTYACSVETDIAVYLLPGVTLAQKQRLSEIIKDKGFRILPTYENKEDFDEDYNHIIGEIAPIKMRLEANTLELNSLLQDQGGGKGMNDDYFDDILNRLWKHYKQPIKERDITVTEFARLVKGYIDDLKAANKIIASKRGQLVEEDDINELI